MKTSLRTTRINQKNVDTLFEKKLPKIKMLVFDLDDTVVPNGTNNISSAVKQAFQRAMDRGIKLVMATGRSFPLAKPAAQEIGLKTPLITGNGTLVRNLKGETFSHLRLEEDDARKLIEKLRDRPVQPRVLFENRLFVKKNGFVAPDKMPIEWTKVDSFRDINPFNPTKIWIKAGKPSVANEVESLLEKEFANDKKISITRGSELSIDAVNKRASKASAILELAEQWHVKPKELMAIGNGKNDLSMLRMAGLSVAMGNASNGVKSQATFVTDSVHDDGLARAIEGFLL